MWTKASRAEPEVARRGAWKQQEAATHAGRSGRPLVSLSKFAHFCAKSIESERIHGHEKGLKIGADS